MRVKLTTVEVQARLRARGRGVHLVGDWLGAHAVNRFGCDAANHVWPVLGNKIYQPTGCPVCRTLAAARPRSMRFLPVGNAG